MSGRRASLVLAAFFLSGAAGLVYEVVWMRRLVLILGVTSQAVGTVLAVFMGGLALGSAWLGRRADRARSPFALYGWLELGVAAAGVASIFLLDRLVDVYVAVRAAADLAPPALTALRVALAACVLLVPTTLMGATLPILVRGLCGSVERVGGYVGRLYAINTLGAAAGTLLAGFWLIEAVGLRAAIFAAAALNVLAGVTALALARGARAAPLDRGDPDASTRPAIPAPVAPTVGSSARAVLLVFGLTGFLALAYEVLWTRALVFVVGQNSTYAFSTMLVALLLGLVLGSALAARLADRGRDPVTALGAVVVLMGAAALGTLVLIGLLLQERRVVGAGETWLAVTVRDFLRCTAILIVPTTLSGATFPLVARVWATRAERLGGDVGRAYAVNTLGGIGGALAGGFAVLPLLGLRLGLIALGSVNAAAGLALLLARPRGERAPRTALATGAVAVALALVAVAEGDPHREVLERGGREVLMIADGPDSSVAVARSRETGDLQLYVDGDGQAGTELRTQVHLRLLGHLPALLHPDPKSGLVVGFGGGVTTGCLAQHPLERVDVVELSPRVREWAVHWEPYNHDPLHDPKVHLVRDDGRNFLLCTDRTWDVITSDPIDPDDAGVTSLYSREYYELVRDHLNPGGVAAQWITAHYEPDVYRTLVRTFQSVFPHTTIWFAYYTTILVGLKDGPGATLADLDARFADRAVRDSLAGIGIADPVSAVTFLVAGPEQVRELVGPGPLNTDDRPLVEYAGPRWSGTGETAGTIALALERLEAPDWRTCLLAGDAKDAARLEPALGWIRLLLERDRIDEASRAAPADAVLARRYLDLTWELLARPVPDLVVLMVGIDRREPPPEASAKQRGAWLRGMVEGAEAWRAGDWRSARGSFASAAASSPGVLRPAVLAAGCDVHLGEPLEALRTMLAAGFVEHDLWTASAWWPHRLVPLVIEAMRDAPGGADELGLALTRLLPSAHPRAPLPAGASLGDADAWSRWWSRAATSLEVRRDHFVWRPGT